MFIFHILFILEIIQHKHKHMYYLYCSSMHLFTDYLFIWDSTLFWTYDTVNTMQGC